MSVSHGLNLAFEKESIHVVQHEVFALILKTLSDHIRVKFQSIQASPMDTHHLAMFIFLLALLTYATAVVVEAMLRASESIYHTHVGNIRLFAGGLAALLLLSVLDPVLGWIISVIWVCLFVIIAYESFQELFEILCQIIDEGRRMLSRLISGRCLGEEEPNQPQV
ncbi:PROTEIN putative-RELATED [Salix purpurea]|uniref:PROTEIN putative-RELATED n=1 Tax=Salix purpurea TaxID=77065 RepID=A0A9Q1A0R1_SALPP|nr:PROTEIN putative-RELATED [Salix purpurea]